MTVRFSACRSFVEISFFSVPFPSPFFHLIRVGVPFFRSTGHWQLPLNISSVTLTDMDRFYRKENNETAQTRSTSPSFSPITTKPRNPLARESLMASTFSNGIKALPLLYWVDERPPSPVQPRFVTNHSARHNSELSLAPAMPAPNARSRSSANNFDRRGARRPSTSKDTPSPRDPTDLRQKRRFSAEFIRNHHEDSAEVCLDEDLDLEIDGLLDELTDYQLRRRSTMMSAPLLPLPEEFSPTGGPISPQLYTDSLLPPSMTDSMFFGGDSDTPSLVSSSPGSSRGSHFSSTRSPSLRSKKNFTPITPPADGWRGPPALTTVPEHKTSGSDPFRPTRLSNHCVAWSPDPRRVSEDSAISVSSDTRRAHHTNLPPIKTTIPEDSTIRRRAKASISSEQTITGDRRESLANRSSTSHSSDGGASEITEIGYPAHGFGRVYLSNSSVGSLRFARPDAESPRRPWFGAFSGRYSPASSLVDHPPATEISHASPSPKRGMLQSLFSQNGSRDPVKIQSSPPQSLYDTPFVATSSKDKGKKKVEKAERRAQLVAQMKAKNLQEAAKKAAGTPSRINVSGKTSEVWEERGRMWSIDGFV